MRYQFITFFVFISLVSNMTFAEELAPGTSKCYLVGPVVAVPTNSIILLPPSAPVTPGNPPAVTPPTEPTPVPNDVIYISSYCKYRARDYGAVAFRRLKDIAGKVSLSWKKDGSLSKNNIPPADITENVILWWFADQSSNQEMAKVLEREDTAIKPIKQVSFNIKTEVYAFESGSETKIGLDVAGFYGKRDLSVLPARSSLATIGGLLSAGAGIGNPLASYLSMAMELQMNRNKAEKINSPGTICELGNECRFSNVKPVIINTTSGFVEYKIGSEFSVLPSFDPTSPNLVRLSNLNYKYSEPTGDEKAPVQTITFASDQQRNIELDKMYLLSRETSKLSIKGSKFIGVNNKTAFNEIMAFITVNVEVPNGTENPTYQGFNFVKKEKKLSEEDLKKLPVNNYSFADLLSSIELVCFDDKVNIKNQEQICGLGFTKISEKYLDYRVNFSIKGAKTRDANLMSQVNMAQEVYSDVAYYLIPQLESSTKPQEFELRVELNETGGLGRERRKQENIKGVKLKITYYPNSNKPFELSNERSWIK